MTIYDGQPRDRVTGYHGDRDLFSFGPCTSFVPLSGNRRASGEPFKRFYFIVRSLITPDFSTHPLVFHLFLSIIQFAVDGRVNAFTRAYGYVTSTRSIRLLRERYNVRGNGWNGFFERRRELIIDFPRFAYIYIYKTEYVDAPQGASYSICNRRNVSRRNGLGNDKSN